VEALSLCPSTRRETGQERAVAARMDGQLVGWRGIQTLVPDDLLSMLRGCLSDRQESRAWAYAVASEVLTKLVMEGRRRAPETHGNSYSRNKEGRFLYSTAHSTASSVKGRCLWAPCSTTKDGIIRDSSRYSTRYGVRRRDLKSERGRFRGGGSLGSSRGGGGVMASG